MYNKPNKLALYLLKTLLNPYIKADKHKCYMYHLIENFGRVQIEKQNSSFKSPPNINDRNDNFHFATSKAVGLGQWITTYQIEDSTGQLLIQYDPATNTTNTLAPVLPGTDIKVTFTVNVIVPGCRFTETYYQPAKINLKPQRILGSSDHNLRHGHHIQSSLTVYDIQMDRWNIRHGPLWQSSKQYLKRCTNH